MCLNVIVIWGGGLNHFKFLQERSYRKQSGKKKSCLKHCQLNTSIRTLDFLIWTNIYIKATISLLRFNIDVLWDLSQGLNKSRMPWYALLILLENTQFCYKRTGGSELIKHWLTKEISNTQKTFQVLITSKQGTCRIQEESCAMLNTGDNVFQPAVHGISLKYVGAN